MTLAAVACAIEAGRNVGMLAARWAFPYGVDADTRAVLADPVAGFGWLPEPDLTGAEGPDLTPHGLTLGCWPTDAREPSPGDEAAVVAAYCGAHREAVRLACGLAV